MIHQKKKTNNIPKEVKTMASLLIGLLLTLVLTCCGISVPEDAQQVNRKAMIMPDNDDAVLPPNIAPLNFRILEQGDNFIVRFSTKSNMEIVTKNEVTDIPLSDWHDLLANACGDTLYTDIYVKKGDRWMQFTQLKNPVVADSIDRYLTYRMIQPSYVDYEGMTIRQRDVSTFDERVLYDNMMLSDGDNGQCINCHVPQNQNKQGLSMFHVRQFLGGTILIDGQSATKVNLKTDSTLSAGVYPAWHPTENDLIAYSVNETGQVFHTRDVQKIEVIDFASDLILYDRSANKVYDIDCRKDEFESFPTWSPDGRWLYYVSAHFEQQTDNIDAELDNNYQQLKYNIYRRAFNAETMKFGERELVFDAVALNKSASTPRVSPDGKWLVFAMADYGQFHIWHHSSRLYALPINAEQTEQARLLSDHVGSYHSFSSNGRWLVFSSRQDDGNYTRLYMAYFDAEGQMHKPLLLPQKSPDYYGNLFRSYNVPELCVNPVGPSLVNLTNVIKGDALQAEYGGSALAIPDNKQASPTTQSAESERVSSKIGY